MDWVLLAFSGAKLCHLIRRSGPQSIAIDIVYVLDVTLCINPNQNLLEYFVGHGTVVDDESPDQEGVLLWGAALLRLRILDEYSFDRHRLLISHNHTFQQ